MKTSLAEHLKIQLQQDSKIQARLITSIGARPKSHQSFKEECILAAKKIGADAEGPIGLLLDVSYESAVVFLTFLNAQVPMVPYLVNIVNLSAARKAEYSQFKSWIESFTVGVKEITFDFNNPEHFEGLTKLQQSTDCTSVEQLFKIWFACQIEEAPVVPGDFVSPIFDDSCQPKRWSLPGYSQLGLFNFLEEFGGVPFFFCYSPELIYAQVDSPVTTQMLAISEATKRVFESNTISIKKKIAEQAFAEEIKSLIISEKRKDLKVNDLRGSAQGRERYVSLLERMKVNNRPTEQQSIEINSALIQEMIIQNKYDLEICSWADQSGFRGNVNTVRSASQSHLTLATLSTLVTMHDYKGELNQVIEYLKTLEFYKNGLNTSSTGDLQTHEALSEVISFFEDSVGIYLDEMGYAYESFEITLCWVTKSEQGQHYNFHYHPNSFLSGVFYLTSGGGGNTIFRSQERPQIIAAKERPTKWNTPSFYILPEAGKLILFPSSMDHKTTPHEDAANPRYSMAFNVMLNGLIS